METSSVSCGVTKGSSHGHLLFLSRDDHMPMAGKYNLFSCVYDACLVFLRKNIRGVGKKFNEDFANICDWFANNKPSIQFGKEKNRSIFFTSKFKIKRVSNSDFIYNSLRIK